MTGSGGVTTQQTNLAELAALRGQVAALEAAATELRQTEEALTQRNRELALLNQVGQELAATLDLQRVSEQLLQQVCEVTHSEGASVWLVDDQAPGWLVCRAFFDRCEVRSLLNLRLGPGQGIAGWVAQSGQSVIVSDVQQEARFFAGIDRQVGFQTRSLLAVPLRVRETVIGVLEVVNKLEGSFEPTELSLVETLAATAASAVDNARLVDTLRQHAAELEARNEELDAFAHTVAHDLQNPLSHMIGYAELVARDHAIMAPDELVRHLRTIVRAGRKMISITSELLLLASVRQVEEIELVPLDMARIVAEALQRLSFLVERQQAEIVVPETWPLAVGHDVWVEEVWVNYIANALKYGGRPPRVRLGAAIPADRPGVALFWVKDNGCGVPPAEQPRLFAPFSRLYHKHIEGQGLGLSIVRRIIERLGGEVGLESEGVPGRGSTFTFTLPLAQR